MIARIASEGAAQAIAAALEGAHCDVSAIANRLDELNVKHNNSQKSDHGFSSKEITALKNAIIDSMRALDLARQSFVALTRLKSQVACVAGSEIEFSPQELDLLTLRRTT